MNPMQELDLLVSHAASARKALARNQAAAMAGTLSGETLREAHCDRDCPQCKLHCAGMSLLVSDIERKIAELGGMTVNGVSYAFAGRA